MVKSKDKGKGKGKEKEKDVQPPELDLLTYNGAPGGDKREMWRQQRLKSAGRDNPLHNRVPYAVSVLNLSALVLMHSPVEVAFNTILYIRQVYPACMPPPRSSARLLSSLLTFVHRCIYENEKVRNARLESQTAHARQLSGRCCQSGR